MRLSIALVVILLALTSLTFAQNDGNEINISLRNPTSLDPVSISRFDHHTRDVVENIFIGLTRVNARTGQIEPVLAESWTISADGLVWTFALRDDIMWTAYDTQSAAFTEIRPVVASDVVFAIQRACDTTRPSPVTVNLYVIAGCRTLSTQNNLERLPLDTVGIHAIDDTTLQIELLEPAGYFLTITSQPEMRPLPVEFVDDTLGNWIRPGASVTSGPWAIEGWIAGASMRLVRNPFWPDAFEGNVEAVNIRFDVPIDAISGELAAGTYDLARLEPIIVQTGQLSDTNLARSSAANPLTLLGFSFNAVDLEGNPLPGPLDVPEVRRALALALDRDALAQTVFGANAAAAAHFTPRTAMGGPSAPGASFDPAAAQRSLTQAGYAVCNALGVLSIAVSDDPAEFLLAQNIVLQWQQNLGCNAENFPIVQTSAAAVLDSAHNTVDVAESSRFPLWIITWSADYPDAQSWVADGLHCRYGYLRVGRICNNIDAMMDQAGASTDITARFTTYNQVETDLFGGLGTFPVIPLTIQQSWRAQQDWLSDVASWGPFQFDRWTVERP
jgi:oligopeptide transport system substrate-binding protein